jgi:hypothetical protein
MRESAGLLTEVLAELNDQAVRAQQLDEVVARAQERAALYGQAADAVTRLVRDELHEEHAKIRSELERQRARIFRDSIVIALMSFFAGDRYIADYPIPLIAWLSRCSTVGWCSLGPGDRVLSSVVDLPELSWTGSSPR